MGLTVEATQLGLFGTKLRKEREQFDIDHEGQFSATWMKPIGWKPKGKGKAKVEKTEEATAALGDRKVDDSTPAGSDLTA